ncbi:transcriptional regulator [Cellulomonas sp. C5510]|uniref:ArsR/SmtB family transcription factor n=1 Tax=Cellulomonas sp. C5510 TaxID=2871170 RepID=UPI001C97E4C2|nr:winged helix-turn-helix domain-containing protein [Cellulomonas sp. C5510]QZN86206.1 winged helix-turn-helix domain-containing protein [Cellulomonas sp. C5510]
MEPSQPTPAPPDPARADAQHISDPARMRALAHPVRLDLLNHLDDVGEATATECAAHLGQTVANCSFHLRSLAKAGLVEPAPRRGRERPWRAVARERSFATDASDPAGLRAVAELGEVQVRREAERFVAHLRRSATAAQEDPDLVRLTQASQATFWATRDEATELLAELTALTERFAGRAADPARRPAGARLMRLFATANPDLDHAPAPATAPATGPAPQED